MSEAALALSKKYREMAGAVWEATLTANRRRRLSAFDVRRIQVEVYQPLLAHALDIAVSDALAEHEGIDALVGEVALATTSLEQGLSDVELLDDTVGFGLALVPAVASVVAFVAAPNPATGGAAVAAIAAAAKKLPSRREDA
jgi:hypothetical protein